MMRRIITLVVILFSLTTMTATGEVGAQPAALGDITVVITNIRNSNGEVLVSLYNKAEGFPRDRSTIIRAAALEPDSSGQVTTVFEDLPYGEYAIAALHDEDSSQGMSFGAFHIPKEGYCFSNNVKVRFKAPKFKKASFTLDSDNVTQTLKMRN
jgi:uncharacterized protein (DUF2141 family)